MILSLLLSALFIADISPNAWRIVNDGVMGGLSKGHIDQEGEFLRFHGQVSLENNGGFTMIQQNFRPKDVAGSEAFVLHIKGDGKSYQFRVSDNNESRYSYVYDFETTGEWEKITIPVENLAPYFRGYYLEKPNYSGRQLSQVALLIGNKKEENFELLIQSISLQ